jgi:hypothetical protein
MLKEIGEEERTAGAGKDATNELDCGGFRWRPVNPRFRVQGECALDKEIITLIIVDVGSQLLAIRPGPKIEVTVMFSES